MKEIGFFCFEEVGEGRGEYRNERGRRERIANQDGGVEEVFWGGGSTQSGKCEMVMDRSRGLGTLLVLQRNILSLVFPKKGPEPV